MKIDYRVNNVCILEMHAKTVFLLTLTLYFGVSCKCRAEHFANPAPS